jgi:RNA polymerase sigma-70 factor (ECF subfamily)
LEGELDHELVAGAVEGSQRAFREIVERHHSIAYAAVRAVLGDRDDIEDVLQDVFIKVFKGLPSFLGTSKLSTWIYRIARNEAINAARKAQPDITPVEDLELPADAGERPDVLLGRVRSREMLESALASLDDEQRQAIELRYLGDRSYDEIAEIMEIPLGTVKTHIHRGKLMLRAILKKRGAITDIGAEGI